MNKHHPIRTAAWLAGSALFASLLVAPETHGAGITVRNTLDDGTGAHAIATAAFELFDNTDASFTNDGFGAIGRMTLANASIASFFASGNIAAIQSAFVPFATALTLDSTGLSGAFLDILSADTRASQNAFGGSPIYFWGYRGASIAVASEHLIVQLNTAFPTDPEVGSILQATAPLWPSAVASVVVGGFGNFSYDYDGGSGPLPGYNTAPQVPEPASGGLLALGLSLTLGRRMGRKAQR